MLCDQSGGIGIQSSGAKKTGCVIAMHPITRSNDIGVRAPERRPSRLSNSYSSAVPFAWPNTSHADEGILGAADEARRAAEFEAPRRDVREGERNDLRLLRPHRRAVLHRGAFPVVRGQVRRCRDAGWVRAAEWKEWRRTQAD
jgi:hypothetical protein